MIALADLDHFRHVVDRRVVVAQRTQQRNGAPTAHTHVEDGLAAHFVCHPGDCGGLAGVGPIGGGAEPPSRAPATPCVLIDTILGRA